MNISTPDNVTQLLQDYRNGDPAAFEALYQHYFDELHEQARSYLHRLPPNRMIQPTMIVNDVFMRLLRQKKLRLENRVHFQAWAAKAMRRLIVSYARQEFAQKRGGAITLVPLEEADGMSHAPAWDVLAWHEALHRMSQMDERYEQIVVLHVIGGLTLEEVAQALQLKHDRVKTLWSAAKAWLIQELTEGHHNGK